MKYLIVFSTLFFFLTSCKKNKIEEKDTVSIDKTELSFIQKDENKNFNISSNGEWHIEADSLEGYYGPNMGDVRDFTVAPVSGKGNTVISITLRNEVSENYDVDLSIIGKDNRVTVKLKAIAD